LFPTQATKRSLGWGTRRSCLNFALTGLAYRAAGFDAGGAQQAGDLLEMKLDGVGAKDLGLREAGSGVAYLGHAIFEAGDVAFEVETRGSNMKAPAVNTFSNILKA